ncbi:hypothetical protein [Chryseobacterium echinoideorum]|uniref:hypothetical protein n=1 Tax=Chryseobacterium echinoideorum TaxID=1549648 RepID=UPI001185A6BC|nr:hypothetical protein [Chryseobacterium echinoideorum]
MEIEFYHFVGSWFTEEFSIQFFIDKKFELEFNNNQSFIKNTFEIYDDYLVLKVDDFTSITFKIIKMTDNNFILKNLSYSLGSEIILKKGLYELRNIKQFGFSDLDAITLKDFKELVEIKELPLNKANDINGNPTKYYRYWNNEDRYSIIMDLKVVEKLKSNPIEKINVYKKIKQASKGYYTNFFISLYAGSFEEYNYNRDMKEIYKNNSTNYEEEAFKTAFEGNIEIWNDYMNK